MKFIKILYHLKMMFFLQALLLEILYTLFTLFFILAEPLLMSLSIGLYIQFNFLSHKEQKQPSGSLRNRYGH